MRNILTLAGLACLAVAASVNAQMPGTTGVLHSQKISVPRPLNTVACNGSCLEFVNDGAYSYVIARDPDSGQILKTFPIDLAPGMHFGSSTISVNLTAGALPSSIVAQGASSGGSTPPPPPGGNGPVTVYTPVYGSNAQIVGYFVTTYIFTNGVVSNVSGTYVTTRPK